MLPSPPTDAERDSYFTRHIGLLATWGLVGMTGIIMATVRLSISHAGLHVYLFIAALAAMFFLISFRVNVFTHDEDQFAHRELVDLWPLGRKQFPSIDVWLPVAGEPLEVIENSWYYISHLNWPGRLRVYVGDDAASPEVKELAERLGFQYLVRPKPGWMKKAGNLRHLYQHSGGEFALILDADFAPRSDFLFELMPYFEAEGVGIVQSPQHFRVLRHQNWLERGAGAVQELFYRAIQVSREQHNGAVCVGTNAIYRRRALDDNGGTTLYEHSEDIRTGFDVRLHGWTLRYVPINLATGLCPDQLHSFMRQQYRWCLGSVTLLCSRKFWGTPMPFATRCCYLAGFGYYISTAIIAVLGLTLLGSKPKAQASVSLGYIGTTHQYTYLKDNGLPLRVYSMWESWDMQRPPGALLSEASDIGAVPFINWQPLDSADPTGPRFSLPTIVAGGDDAYLTEWANAIKSWGHPVYLRIAHEMNGSWYPWSNYGPAEYRKAWQHVWRIFHRAGAKNARFVWSPDGLIGHDLPGWEKGVVKWWPGSRFVDDLGMSTVVFKTSVKYGINYFFDRLDFLHGRFHKPMVLPEMKIVDNVRYQWLRALGSRLMARSWIRMLIWSDTPSSAQAAGQFGTGNMNWTLIHDRAARLLLKRAVQR